MHEMIAVDGSPLAPESIRMMEYLKARAEELSPADICTKIRTAANELEGLVAGVSAEHARLRPIPGKWTIAEVVDHIGQTQVRAAEELRHLLAGRRPPMPPVYEALRSGAAQWAPWNLMQEDLRDANGALLEVLSEAPGKAASDTPTVKTLVVSLRKLEDGNTEPQSFFAEIGWKEYALLQRLHLLDHRTQVKKLMAAIGTPYPLVTDIR